MLFSFLFSISQEFDYLVIDLYSLVQEAVLKDIGSKWIYLYRIISVLTRGTLLRHVLSPFVMPARFVTLVHFITFCRLRFGTFCHPGTFCHVLLHWNVLSLLLAQLCFSVSVCVSVSCCLRATRMNVNINCSSMCHFKAEWYGEERFIFKLVWRGMFHF